MDRRSFLRAGIVTAGGATALPVIARAAGAQSGTGPYGSLEGIAPDENGVILPPGFTSRVVAVAGEPVGESGYEWHVFPDGAATFDDGEGGWYHTVNSEVFLPGLAGVGAIHYGADGEILDAYRLLEGSIANCGGGPTPWGTFLSGEEWFTGPGKLWEIDPTGRTEPKAHLAMGLFAHEAAAVDPERQHVYQTEDQPDGLLYRYTPVAYPDLGEGLLEAARVNDDATVGWTEVPDPSAAETPTRQQFAEGEVTPFAGGEGIWYHDGWIFFSTKFTNEIHAIDVVNLTHEVIYRPSPDDLVAGTAVLSGVDNVTVDGGSGDVYVAEDGGNMEVVLITPEREVAPFLRVVGHEGSEITGPVFNPRRDRLYFSSQRGPTPRDLADILPAAGLSGPNGGVTFEVSGPFRGIVQEPAPETSTTSTTTTTTSTSTSTTTTIASPVTTIAGAAGTDGGSDTGVIVGVGAAAGAIAVGAMIALRNRARRA